MEAARLDFHALSHRGMVRAENQDHVFAGRLGRTEERYLLAVADGVGGREGGAWASERTLQLLLEEVSVAGVGFQAAIMAANRAVFEEATRSSERRGAATTLTAVLIEGTAFTWANVGDSRGYILRDGTLSQLTRDHSLVEQEIEAGRLTREEAASSPHRNVITRSIGNQPAVDVDTKGPFQLEPGDILLLCSDGLHNLVSTAEMAEQALSKDAASASDALIRLANERGSPDNVSVVICAFERDEPGPVAATQRLAAPTMIPADRRGGERAGPTVEAVEGSRPQVVQTAAQAAPRPRQKRASEQGGGKNIRLLGFGVCSALAALILLALVVKPF
jgi:protein phosphatase